MRIERDQVKTMLILVSLSGAFALGVYVPNKLKAANLDARIAKARYQLGFELADTRSLRRLAEDVAQLQQAVSGAQRYVPQRDELADLLRQISHQLNDQQVGEPEFQTEPIRHGPDYSVMPVSLRFTASFPEVFGFLRQIELMHRLIRIERLMIEADTGDPTRPLKVEIELSTFFSMPEHPEP
ncbi:MAG: type 4a pilus biogenesis protein PilO [Phycisphaeraceae bacterium]